mgnify:CR=1 FL=1
MIPFVSIFITILGLISIAGLKLEEYPNITPVQIVVSASYPGASAEDIENIKESKIENSEKQESLNDKLAKMDDENQKLNAIIEEFTVLNKDNQKYIDDLNFDITNLKISVSSFDESEVSINEMVERIEQDINNNNLSIENKIKQKEEIINEQLFVTADGTTPGYSDGTSVILAEKLFLFGDSDSITISFDLTIGGEIANSAPYDYLKVFLIPETANFEPSSAMQMPQYANADYSQNVILTNTEGGYYVNLITTQTTMNITIPTPQEAHKLVFAWINDDSMGIQPGAIIDNLSITSATESESPCFAPVNLSIENSIDTVAFSWQSAGSETQWEVRLDESTPILVNSTTYQFANIAIGQHTAYVRAICSEETYSQWASIDFEIGNVEPIVTTTEATNITGNSATLTANVQLGSEEITAIGFKYRVANQEEWTIVNYEGENLEEIALEITGLVVATEYEFKAFVACGENEYEGEVKTFTTLASLIDELNSMLSVSLYPNPAKQSTTIELSGMNSDATISIVNMKGQIIKTIEIQPSQSYELNLTDFASGNYYVKIITDNKIITRKLIVE